MRHSLHLTVGISAVTLGDVVRRALNSSSVDLRQPLPLGFANIENGQLLEDTITNHGEDWQSAWLRMRGLEDWADYLDEQRVLEGGIK